MSVEEVEASIRHLKKDSSGGKDQLSPCHLIYSGPVFKNWICKIFNTILELKDIPSSFKEGIILPIYKGQGKDPLLQTSYRGITLTSVMAKTFEFGLLDRLLPTISELNVPLLTQTAYQKGVSCSDGEYPILLSRLKKCWFNGQSLASDKTVVQKSEVQCKDERNAFLSFYDPLWGSAGLCAFPYSVSPHHGPNFVGAAEKVMWTQCKWFVYWSTVSPRWC